MHTIHHGDCLEVMAGMPENSIDAIVTDPPYGLGFMGRKWDALPPGKEWAEQCLRVLKPGGHLLAFGGTRTWHRLAVAIEDAGLEIRDSIAWMHGQGFPKSHASLKPAHEPVVLARKKPEPGEGLLQIDATRIGMSAEDRAIVNNRSGSDDGKRDGIYRDGMGKREPGQKFTAYRSGRWPANVILDEHMAGVLDEQSGVSKTRPAKAALDGTGSGSGVARNASSYKTNAVTTIGYEDQGGASRFFYVAKASKRERPDVDGIKHPTVKPLALMRWLVRLVTPPNGIVLDPFAGSGTTIEAAILEGFNVIGIEREAEYLPLIQHRIDRAQTAQTEAPEQGAFAFKETP